MPNQKSGGKGRRNRRTNSSGDEQDGAAAGATAGGAAAAAVAAAAAAAAAATAGSSAQGAGAAPYGDNGTEAPCATPLVCSLGRPVDLEKDDYQRVVCNSELCPYGNWMHLQCFYEWESSILVQFNCIGRARSWNEKQCRQNMWTKKGYDLAFRFCSCRCGQGHLKKDTDWYQVKRMQDERKKKAVPEKGLGRSCGGAGGASGGGAGAGAESGEDAKKGRHAGGNKLAHRTPSQEQPRRQSIDRQNSQERGVAGHCGGGSLSLRSPCDSPGQSPPSGFSFFSPPSFGGPRGSRHLGEFLKNAVHMDSHRRHLLAGSGAGSGAGQIPGVGSGSTRNAHLDSGMGLTLPMSSRLVPAEHPVQFLRRLDLSELLAHIPRHKLNTYHVRMEDDAHAGQGEDLRKFILSALSASHRNMVNCALCHRALPVFEQFPLVDGTLFLSPSRHEEIEYDVPCHLQGPAELQALWQACHRCASGDAVLLRVQQRAAVPPLWKPGLPLHQALLLLQSPRGLLTNAALGGGGYFSFL
ncbi:headcase protein homolog isoform X2 [Scleropages formosus]|uniref:Hdc homolog, cell cycle regulator n=1 Tax=Scleropages formosus TaxID=113540 RepID=A0A8C9VRS1_SCLFO|nr:headcase protein homolog isoform X2 [Scleropages formosus]